LQVRDTDGSGCLVNVGFGDVEKGPMKVDPTTSADGPHATKGLVLLTMGDVCKDVFKGIVLVVA